MSRLKLCFQCFCISILLFNLSCTQNESQSEADKAMDMRGSHIPEPDLAELVLDLNTGMEEAFNEGKLEEVAAFYADDAIMLGPQDYKIEGGQEILNYWKRIKGPVNWKLSVDAFSRTESDLYKTAAYKNMTNKPVDWKSFVGDKWQGKSLIYQLGHSQLKFKPKGEEVTSDVDFILVWVQQPDGAYKIGVDTYAAN